MSDLFDYLDWRGDIHINVDGFNDVDRMILSQLSYFNFVGIVPDFDGIISIGHALVKLKNTCRVSCFNYPNDEKLAEKLPKTARFKDLLLTGFEVRFDPDKVEQFAAMTVLLPDRTAACVFRGTDSSLIGWKENLNMALSDELPAQLDAVNYLENLARNYRGSIRTMGHSKGGNLAVYAPAFSKASVSRRVIEAINLDGPGFSEYVINSPGYKAIENRIRTIIPRSAIVGVIFSHTGKFTIVDSSAYKLMQHDLYTWKVMGNSPVTLTERDSSSQLAEETFDNWINSLSNDERERFIDGIWSLFEEIGLTDIDEILKGKNTIAILRALAKMDEDTRGIITDTLTRLRISAKQSMRDLTK
jgi:hypothetical protein